MELNPRPHQMEGNFLKQLKSLDLLWEDPKEQGSGVTPAREKNMSLNDRISGNFR